MTSKSMGSNNGAVHRSRPYTDLITITVLLVFFLVLMDWLFLYTGPSYLASFSVPDAVLLLLAAGAFPIAAATVGLGVLLLSGALILLLPMGWSRLRPWSLALAVPALVVTLAALLMVDNFTYTVFGFNVGSFDGVGRYVYALAYASVFVATYVALDRFVRRRGGSGDRKILRIGALLVAATCATSLLVQFGREANAPEARGGGGPAPKVNIVIFSADGLNANQLSVYGYHRPTTPFLDSVAEQFLRVENTFTNAGPTTGSVGALFSGKSPLDTGVIYRPDVFRGGDRKEHFVGVLRDLGYFTIDLSVPYYADARDLGLVNAFDVSNATRTEYGDFAADGLFKDAMAQLVLRFPTETFFLEQVLMRVLRRVLHAVGVRDFVNVYLEVTGTGSSYPPPDDDKLSYVLRFIEMAPEPFFIHVHLLGTHGPKFKPRHRRFSAGQEQDRDWMVDFYDDAIREVDAQFRRLVEHLKQVGKYDSTLLVFTSDHGMDWVTYERIPLLMRFPGRDVAGVYTANAQRLDIPPTLLDYLGVVPPPWMAGRSLLAQPAADSRVIVSVAIPGRVGIGTTHWLATATDYEPPYYSLTQVHLIECDRWYGVTLADGGIERRQVSRHGSPCTDLPDKTDSDLIERVNDELERRGYPVIR